APRMPTASAKSIAGLRGSAMKSSGATRNYCAASAGAPERGDERFSLGVNHVEAADDGIARDDEQRGKARRRGDDVLGDAAVSRKLSSGALLILAKRGNRDRLTAAI